MCLAPISWSGRLIKWNVPASNHAGNSALPCLASSIWGCWCTCLFLFFVCCFSQFLWLRHPLPRPPPPTPSPIHTHTSPFSRLIPALWAAWWEERVHGTRPAPKSKCWDTRLRMQREGGRECWFRQASPTVLEAARGLCEPRSQMRSQTEPGNRGE